MSSVGEGVASHRGGEARDAASGGVGRIHNGHAHGLYDPRARLHGDESLLLVVEALAQIVLLAVVLVRNEAEPLRVCIKLTRSIGNENLKLISARFSIKDRDRKSLRFGWVRS